MDSTRTVRGSVSGRVQGVACRVSLLREASVVTGWVRNSPDGRVVFLASGTPESIDALLDWARCGPALARVDALDVEDAGVAPLASFEVRP